MKTKSLVQKIKCCWIVVLSVSLLWGATATAQVPLTDMDSSARYLGQFPGQLYFGSNVMPTPSTHDSVGMALTKTIRKLNTSGVPSTSGKIIVMSLGFSNTTQEYCVKTNLTITTTTCVPWSFMGQAAADTSIKQSVNGLVMFNGAIGGQDTKKWTPSTASNYTIVKNRLTAKGYSEKQVQIIWFKTAQIKPTISLPNTNADAYTLVGLSANVLRAMKIRYPNLKMVFISPRTYGGYATVPLNPEPYAYENGFTIKWLIDAQIVQMSGRGQSPLAGNLNYNTVVPWISWGPYLWANPYGPVRNDGFVWNVSDVESQDGTHPSTSGETKVGTMLLNFFKTSPYTGCIFLKGAVC